MAVRDSGRIGDGLIDVVTDPAGAAVALGAAHPASPVSDVETREVWDDRIMPWARVIAGARPPDSPPRLRSSDPHWPDHARMLITQLRAALGDDVVVDHIGSTAVPGLPAKPILDLQARCAELPALDELRAVLGQIGWVPHAGSRPDSPGVSRDASLTDPSAPPDLLAKRLLTRPDPAFPAILHVRRADSPFARETLTFRDRLRTDAESRAGYAALKRRLATEHAGDTDYDDYTRAKTDLVRSILLG